MHLTEDVALVGSGEARLSDRHDCNVYAIDAPDGPVLVDAGAGRNTERILERTRETFGDPVGAILTHAHADHSQGGPDLQERGVPVVASESTASLLASGTDAALGLDRAKRDDVYPADYQFTQFEPERTTAAGETLTVGGRSFDVVRTRGHAADHVAYLTDLEDRRACFGGDAVFPDGSISLLNVPGSSLADYREDLPALADRGVDALLPGHGLPKLRAGQASIDRAIEAVAGMHSPPSRT